MLGRIAAGAAVFALLLAALPSEANAAYTEKLTLQAFDRNFRPVEGVEAYIDYPLNAVTLNARTKSSFTNQSGLASLQFTNYDERENSSSRSFTLYVRYGKQLYSYGLIATGNGTRIVSQTDLIAYFLQVKVHDQKGGALRANLTIANRSKESDAGGFAFFQLPPGEYTLKAEAGDAVRARDVLMDTDRAVDIEIGFYGLAVKVTDDRNRPLSARVEVGGRAAQTDGSGTASFYNLSEQSAEVVVQNNQSVKKIAVNLDIQKELVVVFDRTSPLIKELHVSPLQTGAATVALYVEDPGAGASGIDTVIITYEVDGVENQVPAYSIGYNTYEAKIPIQPPKTLVRYVVKATDREGNGVFASGDYAVEGEQGGSQVPQQPTLPQQGLFGSGIETIAILVFVAAIVIFGAFYYWKSRIREEGGSPPSGPQPPKIPQAEG